MMFRWIVIVFLLVSWTSFMLTRYVESRLVQEEVEVLEQMVMTMGSKYWKFNAETCTIELLGMNSMMSPTVNHSVQCGYCSDGTGTDCHVVSITLKFFSLPGVLPPEMAKLPYLTNIDFAYNYLSGSIPPEWFSMKLKSMSLVVNRLFGNIPRGLGNMTSLQYLNLEANQFSGTIPPELGNLANLDTLILSSNYLNGELPTTLSKLRVLQDFRINDNNLIGSIPNFIGSWTNLLKLELHASGLEGPIPSTISNLTNLLYLRISDILGPTQDFPVLANMKNLVYLILRSCNLVGGIPSYLMKLDSLELFDVSFNKLSGDIPSIITGKQLRFIFLTGNLLSGDIPNSIMIPGSSVDFSYNHLSMIESDTFCNQLNKLNFNLYRAANHVTSTRWAINPCWKRDTCQRYDRFLHVHTGGADVTYNNIQYIGDGDVEGNTAKFYLSHDGTWGFSSTGDFVNDNNMENIRNVIHTESPSLPKLYSSARSTPISLTYFHQCLENGKYIVTLYFAEIQYTNDETFLSLGRRVFDIYIQDNLEKKDFNILDQVHRAQTPFQLIIRDVSVSNNFLEVRLYFAGKGTTRIPKRGDYGPIISAISFVADSNEGSKKSTLIITGVVLFVCFLLTLLGAILWRFYFKVRVLEQVSSDELPSGTFGRHTLKQIKIATNDFGVHNKIGEGGFGPVYKGVLSDGTVVAVKQLSSKSRQGNREFLNEIGMISCINHPNLVKLHGFCVEKSQLLLVYEYMENNSLAHSLFGSQGQTLRLDWATRYNICLGIARGLAFLHEDSTLKIVHRDIKATNVLLDKHLNAKISDFGLARLDDRDKTHISTKIAGTIGYMAPEYAMCGYLTDKVDVYSFGIVALEIISGKKNSDPLPRDNFFCLLDWACHLNQSGSITDVVDMALQDSFSKEEVQLMLKVALLCTNRSPKSRPSMSEVVAMLEGRLVVPEVPDSSSVHPEDMSFGTMGSTELTEGDKSRRSEETASLLFGSLFFSQNYEAIISQE